MPGARSRTQAVVGGAGVGGLVATSELAAAGMVVEVCEVAIGAVRRGAGPRVFTMRWVFETVFPAARVARAERRTVTPVEVLARHGWPDGTRLGRAQGPQFHLSVEPGGDPSGWVQDMHPFCMPRVIW